MLNAASGGYSLYHYLGTLERFLDLGLAPDAFVMVVYGGNDFAALPLLWHLYSGTKRPRADRERLRRKRELLDDFRPEFGQCLNAVELFHSRPGELQVAFDAATAVTAEVERVCRQRGIGLLVVYLPAPTEVPQRAELERLEAALDGLGLGPEALAVVPELANRYLAACSEAGIEVLDLRPAFAAADGLLYWVADLHLNLRGHELVARELLERASTWAE